jgi:hypothetical protein
MLAPFLTRCPSFARPPSLPAALRRHCNAVVDTMGDFARQLLQTELINLGISGQTGGGAAGTPGPTGARLAGGPSPLLGWQQGAAHARFPYALPATR